MKKTTKIMTWLAAVLLLSGSGVYFSFWSQQPRPAVLMLLALVSLALLLFWGQQKSLQAQRNQQLLETRRLLAAQEDSNRQLLQTNRQLRDSEQKLAVTLNSIGDAVMAIDAQARITLLNPVAQQLTGWTLQQALGQPVDEVFRICNKTTRQSVTVPVVAALAHGTVPGLANHTLLMPRDGSEYDIADSCAPILDADSAVVGAVRVFRNVTETYAAQQAPR